MNKLDIIIIDKLISLGFKFQLSEATVNGITHIYKYYSTFLGDYHYKFILFEYDKIEYCEHALYIFRNSDDRFKSFLFQFTNHDELQQNNIMDKITDVFLLETRITTLNSIIAHV